MERGQWPARCNLAPPGECARLGKDALKYFIHVCVKYILILIIIRKNSVFYHGTVVLYIPGTVSSLIHGCHLWFYDYHLWCMLSFLMNGWHLWNIVVIFDFMIVILGACCHFWWMVVIFYFMIVILDFLVVIFYFIIVIFQFMGVIRL